MKNTGLILYLFLLTGRCPAQKTVLNYPFEFEKSFLQKSRPDALFLDNQDKGSFAFILKDNKKVNYVLVNEKFKVNTEFTKKVEETIFDHDIHQYLGGTASGNVYHYVYKITDKKFMSSSITYMEETADFDAKTVSSKKVFDIPQEETPLVSFNDHNRYFTITANKKSSDLLFYEIGGDGEPGIKKVHFTVPSGEKKDKSELTGYLAGLKVIREEEEPGLDLATHSAKLFCYSDRLTFVINDGENPTHLFTVDLHTFAGVDAFIDHSGQIEKENRGKSYVSCFLKDQKVFALILNKKDIKIAVYNEKDGSLLNKVVIDGDDGLANLAQPPVMDVRMGNNIKETDVDDLHKVIKAFTKGTEGLTVATNKNGQFVIQVGTYDLVPVPAQAMGSTPGHLQEVNGPMTKMQGDHGEITVPMYSYTEYIPGNSIYMNTGARYCRTVYFKILLDPTTLKPMHGRVTNTIADQVKDYVEDGGRKATAAKQFAIAGRQFYGYYDRDGQTYTIEEIMIRK